ncbi:hypothetical protein PIB19_14080 [Sphingomonas sp. 7/4-4]|uniref:hypothetical protein n=1 Tax=Sphingomonas sp. 7/4-4 TaxID=3018446 RepID=UPI0022F3C975|nr:hypothetical protein [Sphingomonas sp. 7/4-4]WBY06669.1 hypothetical protein PIB19_14080 [Sphingomonas sp. 7/4-4]
MQALDHGARVVDRSPGNLGKHDIERRADRYPAEQAGIVPVDQDRAAAGVDISRHRHERRSAVPDERSTPIEEQDGEIERIVAHRRKRGVDLRILCLTIFARRRFAVTGAFGREDDHAAGAGQHAPNYHPMIERADERAAKNKRPVCDLAGGA